VKFHRITLAASQFNKISSRLLLLRPTSQRKNTIKAVGAAIAGKIFPSPRSLLSHLKPHPKSLTFQLAAGKPVSLKIPVMLTGFN
jgi:hypothetical protein